MAAAAETSARLIETLRSEERMTHLPVPDLKRRCKDLAVAAVATKEVVATRAVAVAATETAPIVMMVAVVVVATVTVAATEVALLLVHLEVVLRSPLLPKEALANFYLTISDSRPSPKTTIFTSTI